MAGTTTSTRDQQIAAHMRLVHHTVLRYCRNYVHSGYTHDDAVQAGVIGLMRAIDTHDPNRGAKFSTHAVSWIRQAVQQDAKAFHGVDFRSWARCASAGWVAAASLDAPIGDEGGATVADTITDVTAPVANPASDDPRLVAVLAVLNDKDRVAVLHHELLAADLLGQSRGTVARRRWRAYDKARRKLGVAS